MVRSMTGFGAYELKNGEHVIRVLLRSTNGKSLKIISRLNEQLSAYETEVEKAVRRAVERGTVDVAVEFDMVRPQSEYEFNVDAIKAYYNALRSIKEEVGCDAAVDLSAILALPGTLSRRGSSLGGSGELRDKLVAATEEALKELIAMRENEGKVLGDELRQRADRISELLAHVEEKTPEMVADYRDRLRERVQQLLDDSGTVLDESNLAREVALFAQRSDICEEITRTKSHIQQVRETLDNGGPMGRKLDFIAQELSREANTMAAKAGESSILRDVVEIRAEVDRMREQILNIE